MASLCCTGHPTIARGSYPMPTYRSGRHELGQNFLTDRKAVDTIVDLVSRTDGPIIEIGSGDGALTLSLQALGRPITAIEIDPRHARQLRQRVDPSTTVVHADFLRYRLPEHRTPSWGTCRSTTPRRCCDAFCTPSTGQQRSWWCSGRLHAVVRWSVARR